MVTTDYLALAVNDAKETAENFFEEIIEQIIDSGDASNDLLNDYPGADSYHFDSNMSKDYSLVEASMLLDQLNRYKETDRGLWEGLEPEKAVICQAACTYRNAVMDKWGELIDEINADDELQSLILDYQSVEDGVHAEMDDLEEKFNEIQDEDEWNYLTNKAGEFKREEFIPPWNVDDKIKQRQEKLTVLIENKVKENIYNF